MCVKHLWSGDISMYSKWTYDQETLHQGTPVYNKISHQRTPIQWNPRSVDTLSLYSETYDYVFCTVKSLIKVYLYAVKPLISGHLYAVKHMARGHFIQWNLWLRHNLNTIWHLTPTLLFDKSQLANINEVHGFKNSIKNQLLHITLNRFSNHKGPSGSRHVHDNTENCWILNLKTWLWILFYLLWWVHQIKVMTLYGWLLM